ncbi:hypothetical protein HY009_06045 [Candidatus Acetothermia bacterium]|nr:hypothetical protein [Candidatus Acetothermia bacterium]
MPAGQKQIVKIQFDTGKQTADLGKEPFVIRNAQPGQTFVLNAKVLDAQQTGQVLLIDKQQSQTIRVIPQIVTLGFQGPIGLDPLSPNQGAVPQLSFRVANTGRARIEKRTAALFFSLLRKKPSQSSLPTVDLTLLIADACQVNADTSCTPLDVSEGRPLVPDVDADKFKELRVRFITSVLERGSYELHACMKKIASTARFCDPTERPSNSNPDLIDTFALTFDLSPPEGELRLNLESPPEIQQGKDVSLSLIFILENRTAVFLKSVALSFELRVDSVLPPGGTTLADCTELSGGSGTKILDGSKRQCVLTNLGPSQARRFQVKFPPSEYKTGQQLIITVSEASTFRVSAASFTLQVVETSTTPRPTTQQGPELHPLSLEFTPTSPVTQGQTVLIRSRIENSGSQFTGSFTVDFQIFKVDSTSGTIKFVAALGETRHFPGIDPSVTIEASTLLDTCARDASGKCTLELGTYIVKVVVSTVPNELDRTNNELSTLLTIQAPKK